MPESLGRGGGAPAPGSRLRTEKGRSFSANREDQHPGGRALGERSAGPCLLASSQDPAGGSPGGGWGRGGDATRAVDQGWPPGPFQEGEGGSPSDPANR